MPSKNTPEDVLIQEFWISGFPAPYSTQRERPWKDALKRSIPRSSGSNKETGVDLEFFLPHTHTRFKEPDLDNLCEPVFSILVNHCGWFRSKRPNILWWRANKRQEEKPGCKIRLWSGKVPEFGLGDNQLFTTGIFEGPLPSAQNKRMRTRAQSLRSAQNLVTHKQYHLHLQFGTRSLNLGDIATGPVKYTIDCLAPFLGNAPQKVDDWRITALQVEKGVTIVPVAGVKVSLWSPKPRKT